MATIELLAEKCLVYIYERLLSGGIFLLTREILVLHPCLSHSIYAQMNANKKLYLCHFSYKRDTVMINLFSCFIYWKSPEMILNFSLPLCVLPWSILQLQCTQENNIQRKKWITWACSTFWKPLRSVADTKQGHLNTYRASTEQSKRGTCAYNAEKWFMSVYFHCISTEAQWSMKTEFKYTKHLGDRWGSIFDLSKGGILLQLQQK